MFCSRCGTANAGDAKFCIHCGAPMNEVAASNANQTGVQAPETLEVPTNYSNPNPGVISNMINPGGVRKALKADAKARTKTPLVLATLVYLIICGAIGAIIASVSGVDYSAYTDEFTMPIWASSIESILFTLVGAVFGYGILSVAFDAVRGKPISFGDVFTRPFKNMKNLGYYLLVMVLVYVIGFVVGFLATIIPFLGFFLMIGLIVASIYYGPAIDIFLCVLADENTPKETFTLSFKRALDIIKGHRVEYYGTNLSFFGWWLLSILTFGILLIWILPYMRMTVANMYRRWTKEVDFNVQQTGLSNGAVIGLSVGGCGGCFVVFIIFFIGIIATVLVSLGYNVDAFDKLENYDDNHSTVEKSTKNTGTSKVTMGSGSNIVTFKVPSGFDRPYDGNDSDYSSFHMNDGYDSIKYSHRSMDADKVYGYEMETITKYRYADYQYVDNEFTATINNKTMKVHTTKVTTSYDTTYTEVYTVYPVNSSNSIEIEIQAYDKDITADNIKNYIIVK